MLVPQRVQQDGRWKSIVGWRDGGDKAHRERLEELLDQEEEDGEGEADREAVGKGRTQVLLMSSAGSVHGG